METAIFGVFVITLLRFVHPMSVESYNSSLAVNGTDDLGLVPDQYYMNGLCGHKINLHSRDALLMSPWKSRYPPSSSSCVVGIDGNSMAQYHDYRFVITFKEMSLYRKSAGVCWRSKLDLFNGASTQRGNLISDTTGLCGTQTGQVAYETHTNFLTMEYVTSNLPLGTPQYFESVITPFHYGTCRGDEFKCNNGKCIKNNMICDSYNNCGDDSDEISCIIGLTIAAIVGIVIGCLVFVAVVVTVIVCCCCCGWCAIFSYQKL